MRGAIDISFGILVIALSWAVDNWRTVAAIAGGLLVLHALSFISRQLMVLSTQLEAIYSSLDKTSREFKEADAALEGDNTLSVLGEIKDELVSIKEEIAELNVGKEAFEP